MAEVKAGPGGYGYRCSGCSFGGHAYAKVHAHAETCRGGAEAAALGEMLEEYADLVRREHAEEIAAWIERAGRSDKPEFLTVANWVRTADVYIGRGMEWGD